MGNNCRKIILLLIDAVLINLASIFTLLIRFEGNVQEQYINVFLYTAIPTTVIQLCIFAISGLYRSLWKYAGTYELMQVFIATFISSVVVFIFGTFIKMKQPNSFYLMWWFIATAFIGCVRISYRLSRRFKAVVRDSRTADKKKVMIIGAGSAAVAVMRDLHMHKELNAVPVVAVDDNCRKHGSIINGIPIEGGRERIKELVDIYEIDEIIIAIPSAPKKEMMDILNICKETKCKLKTLPGIYEIVDEPSISQVRDVNIDDLLGREQVKLNTKKIADYLKDEVVFVTGGGGSIGSELCRQIARFGPKLLVIFDIYENNAYDLQNELMRLYKEKLNLEVLIGSVRDKDRLNEVFDKYRPGVVFHAAAHKHVPLMEANPAEAIKNNVIGTLKTVRVADKYNVKKFVLISTDKAVNPTNIMGATKRMAEMIIQSMNKISKTEFAAVRFGNVLGSNGSVIPLFKKQI